MHLFRLRRKGAIRYDEMTEVIVYADTSLEARELASKQPYDEGVNTWLNESKSSCEVMPFVKGVVSFKTLDG